MKKNLLAVAVSSAALLFAAGAYADGGPEPEAPPPPPPAPEPAPEPAPAYEAPSAEYKWYTTIFAGAAFGDDLEIFDGEEGDGFPLDMGYLLGWTLGYDNMFDGDMIQFRPEVELSFRQQDVDLDELEEEEIDDNFSMPTDILSLMGNVWVDFDLGGGLKPYLGGGAGIGWADLPLFIESTDFVWQFGGGVNFDVNERVFVGLGYRYFGGDFEEDIDDLGGSFTVEYEYRAHEVLANLGVRF